MIATEANLMLLTMSHGCMLADFIKKMNDKLAKLDEIDNKWTKLLLKSSLFFVLPYLIVEVVHTLPASVTALCFFTDMGRWAIMSHCSTFWLQLSAFIALWFLSDKMYECLQLKSALKRLQTEFADLTLKPTVDRLSVYIGDHQRIFARADTFCAAYETYFSIMVSGFAVATCYTAYMFILSIHVKVSMLAFLGVLVIDFAFMVYSIVPMTLLSDQMLASVAFVFPNAPLWHNIDVDINRKAVRFLTASHSHPKGIQLFQTFTVDRSFIITVSRYDLSATPLQAISAIISYLTLMVSINSDSGIDQWTAGQLHVVPNATRS